MSDEREMYFIDKNKDKPKPTRREVLANLGQTGALLRPKVTREEFFNKNNIAAILEKIQDNTDVIINKNFVHEVLELMECVYKSRPNWEMGLPELNTSIIQNVVKNIQCGDKISSYSEPDPVQIQRGEVKPPNYLYDIKYIAKPELLKKTDTAVFTDILQKDKSTPVTLYRTAKQTHNYREFFVTIDSRDRDAFANPSASRYSIDLLVGANKTSGFVSDIDQRQVKDVVEVSLIGATMPNIFKNSLPTYQQPYLYIDIDEFPGEMYTSSALGRRIFGKMEFDLGNLPVPTISFVNMITNSCVRKWWYKDPRQEYQNNQTPLAKLDKITVNILDYDGNLFSFGEDSLDVISVTSVALKTRIETPTAHNLSTNDLVYFKNIFNPIPPVGDGQLNTALNRASGFLVDAVISATEFDINLNTSTTAMPFILDTAKLIKANLQHSLTFMIRAIGGS